MAALDLVRKTRDGIPLLASEVHDLVRGYTSGEIPDSTMAAWLMAVCLKGLCPNEIKALTGAMLQSGAVFDRSPPGRTVVDKHSTGGVGDKTTLIVTPLLAAAGLIVPTISGRSLGHAGGTLDKLEAIPGLRVDLTWQEFGEVVERCHCAIVAQSSEIVPADYRIYALRHATATVESPALICASIMSKKLAEGLDALVLDVKTGSGAFMQQEEEALELARLMVEVGRDAGTTTIAMVTDMNQPLGRCIGNALEVREALEVLRGEGPQDVTELSLSLVAHLLHAARASDSVAAAHARARKLLESGQALERFRAMVSAQCGDPRAIDEPDRLPRAAIELEVRSERSGYVSSIDCQRVGRASLSLMASAEGHSPPDLSTGVVVKKKLGDAVEVGESLCTIHANRANDAERVRQHLLQSYHLTDQPPKPQGPLIRHLIS